MSVLKVALRPKWIGVLVIALLLASLFVVLANWQFDRARTRQAPPKSATETVKPFNSVAKAQAPLPARDAYQKVSLSGNYRPRQQIVIPARELHGRDGYWVVTMFEPDGATVQTVKRRGRPIEIPVVRGWTASEHEAETSRASGKHIRMIARIQPIEGPTPTDKMPAGQMATLSTAQLVNKWDVLSYAGYLLPMSQSGPGATSTGLTTVPAPPPKAGGINLQSLFYAIEWIVFALFAVYVWWRMVRDEYLREIEEAEMADRLGTAPEEEVKGT
ncbi:SURF1 family protein [Spelaeicoccus albus]|uniref:SURF1 family protein n=1 Tax=Spelaeicoccus albus TaxID=1280376 RepID=UPI0015CA5AA1|nr:SURF1 family protein [Spelaeicoccus albus]